MTLCYYVFEAGMLVFCVPKIKFTENIVNNCWNYKIGFIVAFFFGQYFMPFAFYEVWDRITLLASGVLYMGVMHFYILSGIFMIDEHLNILHQHPENRA